MFQTPDAGAAARRRHAGQAVRFLRRDGRRRLAGAGRAVRAAQRRSRAADSTGGARACSAGAPITGAASRCASVPTTSSRSSRDGLGFDWPIAYEDVAPYYDKVEMLIGVYGANEGLENTPDSPPGCLLPPPKPRVSELLVKQRARSARHSGDRRSPRGADAAARSRALAGAAASRQSDGAAHPRRRTCSDRAACFWATPCGRGCSIRANYQSTTVHLPPALATGNLDISHRRDGRARSRSARDGRRDRRRSTSTGRPASERHVKARVVVLAASACETVRILLNSKSAALPERPRQLQRPGRPLPHGHRRQPAWAARFRCWRTCRRTTRTARRACTCTCRGGSTRSSSPASSASPRGYHIEFGGGRRHAGRGHVRRPGVAHRRQLRPRSSRKTRAATTARSWTSPAAAR